MIRLTMDGAEQVRANLRSYARAFPRASQRAMKKVMREKVLRPSKELVPVDKGKLRKSGRIVASPTGRSVWVTYGNDETAAYCLAVHEHLSEHSPPSWIAAEMSGRGINWTKPGTGPKFLERPFMESANSFLGDLGQELQIGTWLESGDADEGDGEDD